MKKVLLTATVQSHICQFHRPLVNLLHQMGYEVHVAARNNLGEKNGMKLDFADKVYDIPFARSPFSKTNIKAYKLLKEVLNENHYEIIHCNTPVGGIVTRMAANKFRKSGTKVFYTAHGFHFYEGASKINWLVYYPIEKLMSRRTDKLITITHEDYKLASERFHTQACHVHGVGVNSDKFVVFTEDEKKRAREKLGYEENDPLILVVGELLPNKNQAMAIRAMQEIIKEFPTCHLLLAGNGSEEANLKQIVAELGLQNNVEFLGYCLTLEIYENICNISASCSYREGLPLNIMEAMLSKKPVVATVNRGHKELVVDGKTGYLVQPNDVEAFSERIIRLLKDQDLLKRMGEEGFKKVHDFTDKQVMKELFDVYDFKKEQ
ncbi:MAG: glycosyltransferase family 4 protein [Bacillota bacterium]|nr:glycosyltransferase family 4 protein [Bacillota bacterium]